MGWWVRLSDIAREISVTILARCWSEIKIRSWFLWQVVYNRIKTMQVTSLAVHIYTDAYIYIYPCHVCITWTYYRIALRTYQLFPELAFVQEKSRRPKTMAMVPMMSHDVARCLIFHVPNTHIFYAAYKDMLYVPFCRCRPVTLRSSWMPWPSTKSIRWCSGPDVGPCHLVVGHPGGDRVGMWIWTFAYVCICHYLQICW